MITDTWNEKCEKLESLNPQGDHYSRKETESKAGRNGQYEAMAVIEGCVSFCQRQGDLVCRKANGPSGDAVVVGLSSGRGGVLGRRRIGGGGWTHVGSEETVVCCKNARE